MAIIVHHQPVDLSLNWTLHAWQGNSSWDIAGTLNGNIFDFALPERADARRVRFKFFRTDPVSHKVTWEPDDFIRIIRIENPTEVWSFESTGRLLYSDPSIPPAGSSFNPGGILTFHLITQRRFKGGFLYLWNPYDPSHPSVFAPESSRDDALNSSTFLVTLAPWMTAGCHFKLMNSFSGGAEDWEPETGNRVWRPTDGDQLWCKSGQVSIRKQPLTLTTLPVEVLMSANLPAPPALTLFDPVEFLALPVQASSVAPYPAGPLFKVASYQVAIYPDAAYTLTAPEGAENPGIVRPFPADPDAVGNVSRFALGVDGWLDDFPPVAPSTQLVVQPLPVSSFPAGLSVEIALGSARSYVTVPAQLASDGSWQATLEVAQGLKTSVRLLPAAGNEPRPYDWIDISRFFTPQAGVMTIRSTEGVYGMVIKEATRFREPAVSRRDLMEAAFGKAIVAHDVFGAAEMPHGMTRLGNDLYFVIHAPHAVTAALVIVDENGSRGPARRMVPMSLTSDIRYWWCQVAAPEAVPGTRYRFALNDTTEVIDPAVREVLDRPKWDTSPDDDPADPDTSWSLVLDVEAVRDLAHQGPWQTMGWEALLVYQLHAKRFTDLTAGALTPFQVLSDELKPTSRLGKPGYLGALPATAFAFLPVHEFKSDASWGYNPACFFAVDSSYGGAEGLAGFVQAAHQGGRGVILDIVYNHSLDSPLMKVAWDVYRNGDAYGDRMNCGHPMVLEFLRQATVYLWRTFGVDGFRFDDTKTILSFCQGGWDFLAAIRSALRGAADAEGQGWPYCVAENDAQVWDMTNPAWNIMDGEWALDEAFRILDSSYLLWNNNDNAADLKREMDQPSFQNRPFHVATRFGESHDMVSGQDENHKRIAMRPPLGQGLQLAKSLGTATLLSNGVPMLFMGQEVGETRYFSFDNNGPVTNPQLHDVPPSAATDNTRVLSWFRALMGLRNDPSKGLRGDRNYQVVRTGRRTVAFTCGHDQQLFAVVTFGTPDQYQDSSWLGLPPGRAYKEIFNSSWPAFQVEFEQERSNGGYDAEINSGQLLNLPRIGAVVLEKR